MQTVALPQVEKPTNSTDRLTIQATYAQLSNKTKGRLLEMLVAEAQVSKRTVLVRLKPEAKSFEDFNRAYWKIYNILLPSLDKTSNTALTPTT